MHGVVPKSIWNNINPADELNLCTWSMRCLLIEDGDKLILIDTGIGDKQSEKFFSYYHLHGDDSLIKSIRKAGFSEDEVTDVILTHLHFDHVGGAVIRQGEKLIPQFKNATYWSNEKHWDWALNPNPREKASFLEENISPIMESGQLGFIDKSHSPFEKISFYFVDGHTEQQMLPIIQYQDKKIAYVADLIPSVGHIKIPYVMSYDVQPLLSMQEKADFLQQAHQENYILFFEHDYKTVCGTLVETEKGIMVENTFNSLVEVI